MHGEIAEIIVPWPFYIPSLCKILPDKMLRENYSLLLFTYVLSCTNINLVFHDMPCFIIELEIFLF